MEAIVWRDAQGGDPIDNVTAESLEVFYAAKSVEGQRARVIRIGEVGPWQVSARDLAGTYTRSLGHVELIGGDYMAFYPRARTSHSAQAALLYAIRSLL